LFAAPSFFFEVRVSNLGDVYCVRTGYFL